MSDKALWETYVKSEQAVIALKDQLAEVRMLLSRAEQFVLEAATRGDKSAKELLDEIVSANAEGHE